jgi:Glycosyltransferase family 87
MSTYRGDRGRGLASRGAVSRPGSISRTGPQLVLAVAVFVAAWALLHVGFWERDQIVDTPVYERYGDALARGEVPYRDFRPEYPPLALPVFWLPSAVGGDYRTVFEWVMLACGAAMVAFVGLAGGRGPRLFFAAVFPLLLGSVVLTRYDLWPAALTAAALAGFLGGRGQLGAGALGLAVAAKLYPLVLAPVLLRRKVEVVILGAVAAAFFLPFVGAGLADALERQLSRPLQIESLAAAALVVFQNTSDLDLVEMVGSHGSQNIGGVAGDVAGWLTSLAAAAVLVWLWVRFRRGPHDRERVVRYAAASLVAFVALGKVLSPQFLIWLVPVVALVRGRAWLLLAAALVLTQLWFPYRYWDYAREFDEGVAWIVLARDLVLVALLVTLAREAPRSA